MIFLMILCLCGYLMLRNGVEATLGEGPLGYTFFLNPITIFIATVPNIINRILGSKPIAYLGAISISIYFTHTPLQELFIYLSERATGSGTFTDNVFFLYLILLFPVSILVDRIFKKQKRNAKLK